MPRLMPMARAMTVVRLGATANTIPAETTASQSRAATRPIAPRSASATRVTPTAASAAMRKIWNAVIRVPGQQGSGT